MCALLPRILRFRSALNPPMTLIAPESENEPSATAKIERPLMSVRNPLFLARTCRAAMYDENERRSSTSSTHGRSATTVPTRKRTPATIAPARTSVSRSVHAAPRSSGSFSVQNDRPRNTRPERRAHGLRDAARALLARRSRCAPARPGTPSPGRSRPGPRPTPGAGSVFTGREGRGPPRAAAGERG